MPSDLTPTTKAELEEAIDKLGRDASDHRRLGRPEAAAALEEEIHALEARLDGAPEMVAPDLETEDVLAINEALRQVRTTKDAFFAALDALEATLVEHLDEVETWAGERMELVAEEERINKRLAAEAEAEAKRKADEAAAAEAERRKAEESANATVRQARIDSAKEELRNGLITDDDVVGRFSDDVPAIQEVLGTERTVEKLADLPVVEDEGEDTGELPVVEAPPSETEEPTPPLESEQTQEGDGATAGDDGTALSGDAAVSEPADEPGAEPPLP